jgi:hypothetical protein
MKPDVIDAASLKHAEALERLAEFLNLRRLVYEDEGTQECLHLTRMDGAQLKLRAAGNRDQGAFFIVGRASAPTVNAAGGGALRGGTPIVVDGRPFAIAWAAVPCTHPGCGARVGIDCRPTLQDDGVTIAAGVPHRERRRLVCAAPALLEALEAALEALRLVDVASAGDAYVAARGATIAGQAAIALAKWSSP